MKKRVQNVPFTRNLHRYDVDTVRAAKDTMRDPKPPTTPAGIAAKAAIIAAADALLEAEAELTEADTKVGRLYKLNSVYPYA